MEGFEVRFIDGFGCQSVPVLTPGLSSFCPRVMPITALSMYTKQWGDFSIRIAAVSSISGEWTQQNSPSLGNKDLVIHPKALGN